MKIHRLEEADVPHYYQDEWAFLQWIGTKNQCEDWTLNVECRSLMRHFHQQLKQLQFLHYTLAAYRKQKQTNPFRGSTVYNTLRHWNLNISFDHCVIMWLSFQKILVLNKKVACQTITPENSKKRVFCHQQPSTQKMEFPFLVFLSSKYTNNREIVL